MTVVRDALPTVDGRVIVNCSTVAPATDQRMADEVIAAGGQYLDAPVSGGPSGAKTGSLCVMVGGSPTVLETVRPVLDAFAARVVHGGAVGAGQVLKACNQALVGAQMLALAEVTTLVRRLAIDPAALHDVLSHSTSNCVMVRTRFPAAGVVPDSPASNSWRPDFTSNLMLKDVEIAHALAASAQVRFSALPVLRHYLHEARANGLGDRDWSSITELVETDPRG
jgi:3-hydroxyisobutyrate dehydrogenase-like beta-hydroxyacid dehydrogenase